MPADMHWQVQEVKQRLSEVLRAAEAEGVQYVTRHGEEVAVILSVADYHRLRGEPKDLNAVLLGGPKIDLTDDEFEALFARRQQLTRVSDLSDD